mmetsp:Transcript_3939/g.7513  ORF Transcript_3939/g.7513 Transcript_3939/m.7513 type:complete len:375 (+) Transcript_3939:42-1166(+)
MYVELIFRGARGTFCKKTPRFDAISAGTERFLFFRSLNIRIFGGQKKSCENGYVQTAFDRNHIKLRNARPPRKETPLAAGGGRRPLLLLLRRRPLLLLVGPRPLLLLLVALLLAYLGVGIYEPSENVDPDEKPRLVRDYGLEQKVSDDGGGYFVETPDDGVGGGSGGLHAGEGGEVEKEADEAGVDVFGEVAEGVDRRGFEKGGGLAAEDGHGEEEDHGQEVVVEDHTPFGQFDGLRGVFHVEYVACGTQTVGDHPEYSEGSDLRVVLGGGTGSPQHDEKRQNDQKGHGGPVEIPVSERGEDVGHVFEDGHHGHGVVLQRGHPGEEHETEKDVHGRPLQGGPPVEGGIFHPGGPFAHVHGRDGHDRLEKHQKNV